MFGSGQVRVWLGSGWVRFGRLAFRWARLGVGSVRVRPGSVRVRSGSRLAGFGLGSVRVGSGSVGPGSGSGWCGRSPVLFWSGPVRVWPGSGRVLPGPARWLGFGCARRVYNVRAARRMSTHIPPYACPWPPGRPQPIREPATGHHAQHRPAHRPGEGFSMRALGLQCSRGAAQEHAQTLKCVSLAAHAPTTQPRARHRPPHATPTSAIRGAGLARMVGFSLAGRYPEKTRSTIGISVCFFFNCLSAVQGNNTKIQMPGRPAGLTSPARCGNPFGLEFTV